MKTIHVSSIDVDCNYIYAIDIPESAAREILEASESDKISWGDKGACAVIGEDTISLTTGTVKGGTSALSKVEVIGQINAQLD